MKQATTGAITTLTEAQLQTRVDNRQIVRNTDNLRSVLEETFKKITDDSITKAEKTKSKFLKEKLERTLNGNKRKAETSLKSMKRKLENKENEIDPSEAIEDDLNKAQRVPDEIYKAKTDRWSLEDKLNWKKKLKGNHQTWNSYEKDKYESPF